VSNDKRDKGKQLLNSETRNSECTLFLCRFFRRQQSRCCLTKTKVSFRDCRHLSTKYQITKFSLQQGINYQARGRFGKTEEHISETLPPREE